MKKLTFLLLVNTLILSSSFTQNFRRSVAILDLDAVNGVTNISYKHTADHIMRVCGISYRFTNSVDTASLHRMVIVTSKMGSSSLSSGDQTKLYNYVNTGGILFASSFYANNSVTLRNLFGVTNYTAHVNNHWLEFDTGISNPALRWLNDTSEVRICLGDVKYDTVITSLSYRVSTAQVLARYETDSAAVTVNSVGLGKAYLFGPSFRDLIATPQQNLDYSAERIYSNGFEPAADVIVLFIKAVYAANTPLPVWKHTIPNKKRTTLNVTHDMDSQTAMDLITEYAIWERSMGITAQYNITCRYFDDYIMGPFFTPAVNQAKLDSAHVVYGHVLASHSVGHFPDFEDMSVFPIGINGAYNQSNYTPYNGGPGTNTTGGTIYGETQVSKNLVEQRFGVTVRSFRSGYLAFPKYLNNVLDTVGYEYNSSRSACDILSGFPYKARTSNSNSGVYNGMYELPLTISDVFKSNPINDTNYMDKVAIWKNALDRYTLNYSPVTLLVHPNRAYKLDGMKQFVAMLNQNDVDFNGFENYLDFWKYRDGITFETNYINDTLKIIIPQSQLPIQRLLGFVVDNCADWYDTSKIVVMSTTGALIPHYKYDWYENGIYIQFEPYVAPAPDLSVADVKKSPDFFTLSPNPYRDDFMMQFKSTAQGSSTVKIFATDGSCVYNRVFQVQTGPNQLQITGTSGFAPGAYVVTLTLGGKTYSSRIVHQ